MSSHGPVNEAVRCVNRHLFCRSCVNTWEAAAADSDADDDDIIQFSDDSDVEEPVDDAPSNTDAELSVYAQFSAAEDADQSSTAFNDDAADIRRKYTSGYAYAAASAPDSRDSTWLALTDVSWKQYSKQIRFSGFTEAERQRNDKEHCSYFSYPNSSDMSLKVTAEVTMMVRFYSDDLTKLARNILFRSECVAHLATYFADGSRAGNKDTVLRCAGKFNDDYERLSTLTLDLLENMTINLLFIRDAWFVTSALERTCGGGGPMGRLRDSLVRLLEKAGRARWYVVGQRVATASSSPVDDHHVPVAGDVSPNATDLPSSANPHAVTSSTGDGEGESTQIRKKISASIIRAFHGARDHVFDTGSGSSSSAVTTSVATEPQICGDLVDVQLVQQAIDDARAKCEPLLTEASDFDAAFDVQIGEARAAAAALMTEFKPIRRCISAIDAKLRPFRRAMNNYLTTKGATMTAGEMTQKMKTDAADIHDASLALSEQSRAVLSAILEAAENFRKLWISLEKIEEIDAAPPVASLQTNNDDLLFFDELPTNSRRRGCPVCRQLTDFVPCPDTDRALAELFVGCPFVDDIAGNCRWTGCYAEYRDHDHQYESPQSADGGAPPPPAAAAAAEEAAGASNFVDAGPVEASSADDLEVDPTKCVDETRKRRHEDSEDDDQAPDKKMKI